MGPERLPRLMLSAWVAHKRPAGAPQFTYGRTIAKAMHFDSSTFNSCWDYTDRPRRPNKK